MIIESLFFVKKIGESSDDKTKLTAGGTIAYSRQR